MRPNPVQASILVLLLIGCSGEPDSGNMANGVAPAAPTNLVVNDSANASVPAGPAGETGMRMLAECSATFEAMARLYQAVANTSEGADAEDARSRAESRRGAATQAELRAREIATQLGRTAQEVDRLKRERHAFMERERARQDFGDFAIWLGRESDLCAALDLSFQ